MSNIFKRWFTSSKQQATDNSLNPWAGLASYEDPETAERQLKFCGRDDESYDLARLIMGNIFVTLYGKSGIGKTSLLNAGVFPELREEQFTPVSLRFGLRDEKHSPSYQTMLIEAVERVVKRKEMVGVVDEQEDQQAIDYLWNYFARHRFYDKNNESTTPVVILDQFEEVFRGHRVEAETLLRQLDYLSDKDHALDSYTVDGQPYRYEQNFRFVISIREDDLYRLEDSIDNSYLPALKRCRYRLRSLSEQGAHDAILIPGEGLFRQEEQEGIANAIIKKSRNDDGSISTNIISLLCSRIYEDYKKSGATHITPALVESFLKGNPFERFYDEATLRLSNKEKSYIEKNLVDSAGRRNSIPESDFLMHVKNGAKLLEGRNRILQRNNVSSDGGSYRIELIHDSFCAPLIGQMEKRKHRRRMKQFFFFACFMLLVLGGAYYIIHSLKERQNKILHGQSRYVAEKALDLVSYGDSYLARLLALEALPKDLESPDRPYEPTAEYALRTACADESAVLHHPEGVLFATFSPDNQIIATASENIIYIWETNTGRLLKKLEGLKSNVGHIAFHPNGKTLVSSSSFGNCFGLWNVETGELIDTLQSNARTICAEFSPNGETLVTVDFESAKVWDVKTKKLKYGIPRAYSARFSPDGRFVVSNNYYQTLMVWSVETGEICLEISGHDGWVHSSEFSPDGESILSSSSADEGLKLWNAKTGELLMSIDAGPTDYASFSPDGKSICSASRDIIYIWDAETGRMINRLSGHNAIIKSIVYSTNGKWMLSSSMDRTARYCISNKGESSILVNFILTSNPGSVIYKPNGEGFILADEGYGISEWTVDGEEVSQEKELDASYTITSGIQSMSFQGDGKVLATVQDEPSSNSVDLWDVQSGQKTKSIETKNVMAVALSYDGKLIATMKSNGDIEILSCSNGKKITAIKNKEAECPLYMPMAFSTDSKMLASAGKHSIYLWNVKTGQLLMTLEDTKYISTPISISFSHDKRWLVSTHDDNEIRVWDVHSGNLITAYFASNRVTSAAFSPDDKHILLSFSEKNEFVIVDFDPSPLQDLIDQTRERFKNRQLTSEERSLYYLE